MAKELPYFRFTVQDWQNGKISLESYELQGLFISVCGYYWINDCSITLAMLKKKFSNATLLLNELIELDIIKHENRHDKVEIEFLNIQYDLLSKKRKDRQVAGSKGGNAKAMLKQKDSYKDKDNNKDNNKDKELTLPYFSESFVNSWRSLLTQKKWKKKSHLALQASLKKLSLYPEYIAIEMIENSIANDWQGLFEVKNSNNTFKTNTIQGTLQAFNEVNEKIEKGEL